MTLITFVRSRKKVLIIGTIVGAVVIALLVAILVVTLVDTNAARGAVVTNGLACSRIGTNVLEKGGTAADAAIAALFCEGVSMPQSMGLGGGFLLTFYQKSTGEAWSLNSREVAPIAATENMFAGNKSLAQVGGLAIAVPAELRGYWSLYNKFGGGVSWRELVQPTIDICEKGIFVSKYIEKALKKGRNRIMKSSFLREMFVDPTTNNTYVEGDYMKRPRLAKTLRIIAQEGGEALHNGSLTDAFVQDIQNVSGIVTVQDMNNYQPVWLRPHQIQFTNQQKMLTVPLPGSGAVLSFILNLLDGYLDLSNPKSLVNYQRLIESFKFGYGRRTQLGDHMGVANLVLNMTSKSYAQEVRKMMFDNRTFDDISYYGGEALPLEDQGTANINVLAPNGDAIAVTSTINGLFGSYVVSPSTGIILNNQMDDFSSPGVINLYGLPPSPANFIVPGRHPLSSMCPSIVLDKDSNVLLAIGAAGGSQITTQVAQIIINHLWFGIDLKTVITEPRLHHQLVPNTVKVEGDFADKYKGIVESLRRIGHNVSIAPPDDGFAAATVISTAKQVTAESDSRRPGSSSFVY